MARVKKDKLGKVRYNPHRGWPEPGAKALSDKIIECITEALSQKKVRADLDLDVAGLVITTAYACYFLKHSRPILYENLMRALEPFVQDAKRVIILKKTKKAAH